MADEELERRDIEAVLETRRELGSSYDAALVDGFADRIERVVEARITGGSSLRKQEAKRVDAAGNRQMILGFVSLGTGIPITAIAGGTADLPGIVAAWLGIAAVNLAHAWQSRGRPGPARP